MGTISWDQWKGSTVGKKYTLERLVSLVDEQAWFEAGLVEAPEKRVAIKCFPVEASTDCDLSQLHDPNLRLILDSGREGELGYIAFEPANESLSGRLAAQGALSTTDAREILGRLISGLEYLHRRDLVYCHLKPSTIVHAGGRWKLGDFTQLRPAGQLHPGQMRLLASSPQAPPEACTGLISPAWDIYSLGVTLRQCLLGDEAGRPGPDPRLPDPFELIVRLCLEPVPEKRIGLAEIALMLGMRQRFPQPSVMPESRPIRPWPLALRWRWASVLAMAALSPAALFLFHGSTPHAMTAPVPQPADRPSIIPQSVLDRGLAREQIRAVIERWVSTFQELDLAGHLDCYAPDFESAAGKQRVFQGIERVRKVHIGRLRYESLEGGRAVVSLEKQWEVEGVSAPSGAEEERLTLRYLNGQWKIAGEEETNIRLWLASR